MNYKKEKFVPKSAMKPSNGQLQESVLIIQGLSSPTFWSMFYLQHVVHSVTQFPCPSQHVKNPSYNTWTTPKFIIIASYLVPWHTLFLSTWLNQSVNSRFAWSRSTHSVFWGEQKYIQGNKSKQQDISFLAENNAHIQTSEKEIQEDTYFLEIPPIFTFLFWNQFNKKWALHSFLLKNCFKIVSKTDFNTIAKCRETFSFTDIFFHRSIPLECISSEHQCTATSISITKK